MNNLEVTKKLLKTSNKLINLGNKVKIKFVKDRPGHDFRYAIDATKINNELGWTPKESFESGIRKTIEWYLNNEIWWKSIQDNTYRQERLGVVV